MTRTEFEKLATETLDWISRRFHDQMRNAGNVWFIGKTVIHEFGHYFGHSNCEIQEIKTRYWYA